MKKAAILAFLIVSVTVAGDPIPEGQDSLFVTPRGGAEAFRLGDMKIPTFEGDGGDPLSAAVRMRCSGLDELEYTVGATFYDPARGVCGGECVPDDGGRSVVVMVSCPMSPYVYGGA